MVLRGKGSLYPFFYVFITHLPDTKQKLITKYVMRELVCTYQSSSDPVE